MPYFSDPNLDNDQQNAQQGQISGPSGVITGGEQTPGGNAQSQSGAPSRSGSWANLVSYINANQGNDSAVGGQIKASVGKDASRADQATQQYQDSANKSISDQTTANQSAVNASKTTPITGFKQPIGSSMSAQYNGPASSDQINEYAKARQQNDSVQNTATLAKGGENDRVSLLDKTFARPGYTQGEKSLDSFILGGGQGGQQTLQDIGSTYGNYGDRFKTLAGTVDSNLNKSGAETKAANDTVRGNLQTTAQQYKQQLADRVASENANRKSLESDPARLAWIQDQAQSAFNDIGNQVLPDSGNIPLSQLGRDAFEQYGKTKMTKESDHGEKTDRPYYNLADQFYQGAGQVDQNQMATADEATGYNNLMQYLGVNDQLQPMALAQGQQFNRGGFQDLIRNQVQSKVNEQKRRGK